MPTVAIAVAEDDDDFRSLVGGALKTAGYDVAAAANGLELLQSVEFDALKPSAAPAFDAVVIDVRMPGVTGLSVAEGLAEAGYRGRCAVCRGGGRVHPAQRPGSE